MIDKLDVNGKIVLDSNGQRVQEKRVRNRNCAPG